MATGKRPLNKKPSRKRSTQQARPPATAGARSSSGASAARSSARSTVSGPTSKGVESIVDLATAKVAGVEAVASSFPFNAAKPTEFGKDARRPATGQAVEPPDPIVSGSTLTEVNASEKVGKGNPQMRLHPTNG